MIRLPNGTDCIQIWVDKSLGEQYVSYLKSLVTMDFGIAYSNKEPVLDNVLYRIR